VKKQISKAIVVFGCPILSAILPNLSFAKDPTLKEKIAALAAEGKTIPVVYFVYSWQGIKGDQTRPPDISPYSLFTKQPVPDAYKAVKDTAIATLNAGYGVTCFKEVPFDSLPKKTSFTKGTVPDWTATDYKLYVSVVVSGVYDSKVGQNGNWIKLTMNCEITIMENYEKKGEKKSDDIKTLRATATMKSVQVKKAYTTWEQFTGDIPADTLVNDLKAAAAKEIAKYAAK
jgi:hypothetical protein